MTQPNPISHESGHHHGHSLGGHSHGGHSHGGPITDPNNARRTLWAAILIGGFMGFEVAGGIISGSLTLLADAGHMLTDFAALMLAWFAFRLSRRPADRKRSYGFDRFEVLVAFVNGIVLILVVLWIFYEAASRLAQPEEVLGGVMAVVAFAGLLINIVAFWILMGADRGNLNIRGASLHVLGDLLGSVAALIGAGIIFWTGWTPIDPILSALVGLLILRSAIRLVRESGHILLEAAPNDLDTRKIGPDLVDAIPSVLEIHHIHAWSITQERVMVTLHARIDTFDSAANATAAIKERLKDKFDIYHATVEIEEDGCADDHAGRTKTSEGGS